MVDGVLFRKWFRFETDDISRLVVVPMEIRQKMLTLALDAVSCGHVGITQTVQKVRQRLFLVNLHSDTADFINSCPICYGRKNLPRKNIAEMEYSKEGEHL